MKRIISFISATLILFTIFSCSNDDYPGDSQTIDPTIIKEYHRLNSDGDIIEKYFFNNLGVLSKIKYSNYYEEYTYDLNDRLTSIIKKDLSGSTLEIKDILYDVNNNITNIGSRTFTYNSIDNEYREVGGYEYINYQPRQPYIHRNRIWL